MNKILILSGFRSQIRKLGRKLKLNKLHKETQETLHKFSKLSNDERRPLAIGGREYKIRMGSGEMKLGKRSGFRILIILLIPEKNLFIPYAIYYKDDYDALPPKIQNKLLEQIKIEYLEWKRE
jgi:mRNA-degrading endonuclease RelE of RelBE toxin-antitoxin system